MRRLDRRSFMALGAGALAWACSRGTQDDLVPVDPETAISLQPTVPTGLTVGDSRQGFIILRGATPITPDGVVASFRPPTGDQVSVEASVQQVRFGSGGDTDHEHPGGTEVVEIFVVRHELDTPGPWFIDVTFNGEQGRTAFEVLEDVSEPVVGDQAIASDSPTVDDPRDVDPICTRNPPCAMHEISLAQALERSRPLVVIFATPRFCTSRTCGPVVDLVEEQAERIGEDASFVHVEVWKNDEDAPGLALEGRSAAFRDWSLPSEPFTYFVDGDGVIRERWLGSFGRSELQAAVDDLVAGEL